MSESTKNILAAVILGFIAFVVGVASGSMSQKQVWTDSAEDGHCLERDGKYYHVREVDAMVNREGEWYPARKR